MVKKNISRHCPFNAGIRRRRAKRRKRNASPSGRNIWQARRRQINNKNMNRRNRNRRNRNRRNRNSRNRNSSKNRRNRERHWRRRRRRSMVWNRMGTQRMAYLRVLQSATDQRWRIDRFIAAASSDRIHPMVI
jgi:hypothetical protein